MILIQTSKWFGPSSRSKDPITPVDTFEALATRLPLSEALAVIRSYSSKYYNLYGAELAVEHTVIGVQYLQEDLSNEDLENGRILLVEEMCGSLDDALAERAAD